MPQPVVSVQALAEPEHFDPQQLYEEHDYLSTAQIPDAPDSPLRTSPSSVSIPSTPYSQKSSGSDTQIGATSAAESLASFKLMKFSHGPTPLEQQMPRWTPQLLRLLPCTIFAGVLLLFIVGLEIFNRQSPYDAPTAGMQFVWTYIPVALLMIVHWIWATYDLQIKVLMPWSAMSVGFSPAQESWLLDYIGGNYFVGLWSAIRLRHFVVLLATLGLWTTALAGIVTTSLFQIQDLTSTLPADFTRTAILSPSSLASFSPSVLADKSYVNAYLGRQVLHTLPRPPWTTTGRHLGEILLAETRGYSADLVCVDAVASYGGNISSAIASIAPVHGQNHISIYLVDVYAAGCHVGYNLTNTNELIMHYTSTSNTSYVGRVYNHTCPGSSTSTTVAVMVEMTDFTFINAAAVECSPSYYAHSISVSVSPSQSSTLNVSITSDSPAPLDVPAWGGMLQWISASLTAVDIGLKAPTSGGGQVDPWARWGHTLSDAAKCDSDAWFPLIGHGRNISCASLLNAATLKEATVESFNSLWSDMAHALLMIAPETSSTPVKGSILLTTSQLVAQTTSIRIAQAALAVLIAVVILVYLLQPQTNLPMDPSSMAAQAVLLKPTRHDISAITRDTVTATAAETRALLKDWAFSVETGKEFRIIAQKLGSEASDPAAFTKAPVWRPPILHPVLKTLLCLILVGTVIVLEFGLRRSNLKHGLDDFDSSRQDVRLYLAPAYLFVLGLFLSSYTFSISTLQPFFDMYTSPQTARKSVRYSPAHRTGVGLALHAIRYRSLVGLSCAFIVIFVPFLKISVSGLFTTASVPFQMSAIIPASTTFNTTSILPLSVQDETVYLPGQILALSQIEKFQLPLPAWATRGGAVGALDPDLVLELFQRPNTSVELPLPVMRADLTNCVPLASGVLPLPDTLQLPCSSGSEPEIFPLVKLPQSSGYFGQVHTPPAKCGEGCALIFGKTLPSNASQIEYLTVVQCMSSSMSLATSNVTLAYPNQANLSVVSIDKTSSENVVIDGFFAEDPNHIWSHLPDATYENDPTHSFDTFMQIMTLHNTSRPLDDFLNPEILTSAAQELFTTYWSIYASQNLNSITAVVNYTRIRLVQAVTPTRILQALLACVLACGLVTVVAVRKTNNVLTKPPYSIGAMMGLLADSAFLELEGLDSVRSESDLDKGWGNNQSGGSRFGVDIAE
ncbi:hypothetical protein C8J57DRAFT_1295498 [Mycena rebaudengoi]|nr:hypothetical protein C8J57DRAFT_1295498 [Mycena rebaudengoi]